MIKNNKLIIGLLTAAMTVSSFGIVPACADETDAADTTAAASTEAAVATTSTESLVTENGVLKDAKGVSGEVVIPDSVTSIKEGAFEGNSKITKLVIPGSIKNINDCTFSYMSALTDVEIKDGVESIGDSAFAVCPKLVSVKLPASLKTIKNGAFGGCKSLKEITVPEGITQLEGNTFSGCTSLAVINLPSTLTRFAHHDFYLTPWLKTAADKDGFVVVNGTLVSYVNDTVMDVKVPDSVKVIGGGALSFCNIKSVVLPESVKYIQEGAFQHDQALESVTLPENLKTIEAFAFTGCDALKNAEIPESVTAVGENAFDENIKLTGKGKNFYELLKSNDTHTGSFFGWTKINGEWYYRNPVAKDSAKVSGYTQTGWLYNNGSWYHFDNKGKMEKGFVTIDGNTYYLEDSSYDTVGIMRTGWQYLNGNWYYFYADGRMASNTTIDNYAIDANGICQ